LAAGLVPGAVAVVAGAAVVGFGAVVVGCGAAVVVAAGALEVVAGAVVVDDEQALKKINEINERASSINNHFFIRHTSFNKVNFLCR